MMSVGTTAQIRSASARRWAWSMSSVGSMSQLARHERHRCAQPSMIELDVRAMAGSTSSTGSGMARSGRTSSRKASRSAADGQLALEEQVPHVLERHLAGQLDRRVLAVVVEALEAPDVADRGLGDDDALEARRAPRSGRGG